MEHIASALSMGVVVFASTNVDDLVLLSAFSSDPSFTIRHVVIGQFIGVAVLVLVSAACALLSFVVPAGWIGLLGLAPLALGVRHLWALWRAPDHRTAETLQEEPRARVPRFRALAVAAVTVANGGDNLGVYIPLFSNAPRLVPLYAAVFAAMTGLWCALGYFLVHNPVVGERIRRYGRTALPFVLIGVGLWILSSALVPLRARGDGRFWP